MKHLDSKIFKRLLWQSLEKLVLIQVVLRITEAVRNREDFDDSDQNENNEIVATAD